MHLIATSANVSARQNHLATFRNFLKCSVAASLLLAAVPASADHNAQKSKPYASLKLLSYNILYDGGKHFVGFDRSVDSMLPFMKNGDFDVITLQEIADFLDSNTNRLATKLKEAGSGNYKTSSSFLSALRDADRSILSRLPGTFGTFDPFVVINSPAPYILLDAHDGLPQTYVASVHTSAADDPHGNTVQDHIVSPFRNRFTQAKRLNEIGRAIDHPLILTGDFNAGDISERGLHKNEIYPLDAYTDAAGNKIPSNIPVTLNILKQQYQQLQSDETREKFEHNDLYNDRYTWPGWNHDHEASEKGVWDRVKIDHIMAVRPYAKWFKVITDPKDPYSGTATTEAFVPYDKTSMKSFCDPARPAPGCKSKGFWEQVKFVDMAGKGLDKDFNLLDDYGHQTGTKGVPQAISDHLPFSQTVQWVGPIVESANNWTKIVWSDLAAENDVKIEGKDNKTFFLNHNNDRNDLYLGQISGEDGKPNLDALKDLQKQLGQGSSTPGPELEKLLKLAKEQVNCSANYTGGAYKFSAADAAKIKSYCTDDHSAFDEVRITDVRTIRAEEDAALGRTISGTASGKFLWIFYSGYAEPLPFLTLDNGTLKITGTAFDKLDRDVHLDGIGGTINIFNKDETVEAPGAFSGNGGLTKDGDGMLKLTNSANSYKGLTTISAGALALSDNGSIASSAGVYLRNKGSVFDISRVYKQNITTINGLSGRQVPRSNSATTSC
jgi:subtilase-type serine protease